MVVSNNRHEYIIRKTSHTALALANRSYLKCSSSGEHHSNSTNNVASKRTNKLTDGIPISFCRCSLVSDDAIICQQQGSCQTRKPDNWRSSSKHTHIRIQTAIDIFDLLKNYSSREENADGKTVTFSPGLNGGRPL